MNISSLLKIYLLAGAIIVLFYLCLIAWTKSENMIGAFIGVGIVYLIGGIYFWKKGEFVQSRKEWGSFFQLVELKLPICGGSVACGMALKPPLPHCSDTPAFLLRCLIRLFGFFISNKSHSTMYSIRLGRRSSGSQDPKEHLSVIEIYV